MATDRLHVVPGGPWIDVEDGPLLVRKLSVSSMDNDVYVLACRSTRAALLVDPADDAPRLRQAMDGFDVVAAVVTHGHADHTRAWPALAVDPGLPMWAHAGDAALLPGPADRWLEDGERLPVGRLDVEVLHVPGHTDGSIVLAVDGHERRHLMTGDTLFPGGPGNTRGDAERHARLMDGIEGRVFARFPDPTWVHPGHGDATTLATERPRLAEWRARGW